LFLLHYFMPDFFNKPLMLNETLKRIQKYFLSFVHVYLQVLDLARLLFRKIKCYTM